MIYVLFQDYQCWCDLRKLEECEVGQRYLTHDSDDARWDQYRKDHSLGDWRALGHKGVTKDDLVAGFGRSSNSGAHRNGTAAAAAAAATAANSRS